MSTAIRGERERAGGKGVDGQRGGLWRGKQKKKKGKEKTKNRKHEKNRKKEKREKTILFNLKDILLNIVHQQKSCKKVQQQIFNFYLTISSSILYICNRMSKFYKSQKMSNLPAYIRLYKC